MPDVRCSVDECHYWKSGNLCTADSIQIEIDAALQDYDNEFAKELSEQPVDRPSATCCHTFLRRDEVVQDC